MGRVLLFGIACAALLMAGCSSDEPTKPADYVPDKAHGEYLVKYVAGCGDCHTQMDAMGAPVEALAYAGGVRFALGDLGTVYSANITPDSADGIGAWTDAEIITAIRTGAAPMKGGNMHDSILFPLMPYSLYSHLTDNDVKDIVAYLRSLTPVSNVVPPDSIPPFARVKWSAQTGIPDGSVNSEQTQRGKYLVTLACADCHTQPAATLQNPAAQGLDMTKFMAGGRAFESIGGKPIFSRNLTPDPTTGLGDWRAAQIDSAFAFGYDDEGKGLCPPMPWQNFMSMSKTDRDAIVAYLRSIPAIVNDVPEKDFDCPH